MSNTPGRSLGGTQLTALVLGVEFEQACRVRVDRNECLDDVADDVDRFAVAEVALPRGVSIEVFALDVLGDQEPVTRGGFAARKPRQRSDGEPSAEYS